MLYCTVNTHSPSTADQRYLTQKYAFKQFCLKYTMSQLFNLFNFTGIHSKPYDNARQDQWRYDTVISGKYKIWILQTLKQKKMMTDLEGSLQGHLHYSTTANNSRRILLNNNTKHKLHTEP